MSVRYVHLPAGQRPPIWRINQPFRAVVVIDQAVTVEWQNDVSDWLVETGCLYMLAWGASCSSWDDSVDWAHIKQFPDGAPDDQSVMTTWHDDESLADVFWFAANAAHHSTIELDLTLIIDITAAAREVEMLEAFEAARQLNLV